VDFSYSPEELAEILTNTGLEVENTEKIEVVKGALAGVVVGEVLSCSQHPDADKLYVTQVYTGQEALQIVCGAPNVSKGQKVLVATVGSTIYPFSENPVTIKKAKIRGIESNGMLCAEDELGIGTDHNGIMVLPSETQPGTLASSYFNFDVDYVFEIGLTPNRADAMGHIGVARDLAAYQSFHSKQKSKVKAPFTRNINFPQSQGGINISVIDDNCMRYMGVQLSGIKVSPSPDWLQRRLRSVGVSPVNNVVDVTNYVMRELGTPLHAFDASKLGNSVVIRSAIKGEELVTLDKIKRTFKGGELLICDNNSPMCIAGVLGGQESGISEGTSDIFLESAVFDMTAVRKTARLHGINSDASFRFERGVDKSLTEIAIRRACQLLIDIAGATITSSLFDKSQIKFAQKTIEFSPAEINSILGARISETELEEILISLDFEIAKEDQIWKVLVPHCRIDVERTCDLAEEVLRIYGFNTIEAPEKMAISLPNSRPNDCRQKMANYLVSNGFYEAMNNSMTSPDYASLIPVEQEIVKITNPLSQDLQVMRFSLLPGLLENIVHNQNRQVSDMKLFEFGKTYTASKGTFVEKNIIAGILTGKKMEENWINSQDDVDFFFAKGIVENMLDALFSFDSLETFQPAVEIFDYGFNYAHNNVKIGEIGKVSNRIASEFNIKKPVYFFQFEIEALNLLYNKQCIEFQELPKTFFLRRDLSLLVKNVVSYEEIKKSCFNVEKHLLTKINLFDVYEGDKIENGFKSYAISCYFQHAERTLTDKTVDDIMQKIIFALKKEHGALLR